MSAIRPIDLYPKVSSVLKMYRFGATERENASGDIATGLTCVVCGDTSTGKHYGILSCNGCSGFFKRSVRRKLIYRCQANTGRCLVDKAHRNQCQACRLKKCLQMGMIKETVQHTRQSRRQNGIPWHGHENNETIVSARDKQTAMISGLSSDHHRPTSMMKHDVPNPDDATSRRILLMIIKWIRHLPTFASLSMHDQLILLEESWSDLFILWVIQYSSALDELHPLFRQKLFHHHETARSAQQIDDSFQQLKVDSVEFVCLKAIVLFRIEGRPLQQKNLIEHLQDQAQLTLAELTRLHHPAQATRFGRLLLTLPLFRRIPPTCMEQLYFSSSTGDSSMSKLLMDMWKNEYECV